MGVKILLQRGSGIFETIGKIYPNFFFSVFKIYKNGERKKKEREELKGGLAESCLGTDWKRSYPILLNFCFVSKGSRIPHTCTHIYMYVSICVL